MSNYGTRGSLTVPESVWHEVLEEACRIVGADAKTTPWWEPMKGAWDSYSEICKSNVGEAVILEASQIFCSKAQIATRGYGPLSLEEIEELCERVRTYLPEFAASQLGGV